MARTLTATTPHGTFTRTTQSPYRYVAVITMKDGGNVRLVGMGSFGANAKTAKAMARWSTTAAGAVRNAENYGYMARETYDVHGPYPVDGTQDAEPQAPTSSRPATRRSSMRPATMAQIAFARQMNANLKAAGV